MKSEVRKAIEKVNKSLSNQIKDINNASTVSTMILAICIIDCIAGFYSGYEGKGKNHKARFNKFTKEYLPEYTEFLYDLRNDIVHSFSNSLNLLFA